MDRARYASPQAQIVAHDTTTSPTTMHPPDPTLSPKSSIGKRNSTRVIRTFEEVQVLKTIVGEEWYEELECGICSGILGATQALVPCGHSFCGPCAWQWIVINKNITCPHCRAQVIPETPLVPNIIVDQIVDRKLKGLPEGEQKNELLVESKAKAEAWTVLQAGMMRSKPKRKTKGFDEWFGLFDSAPAPVNTTESSQRHGRRASRNVELGPPVASERPHPLLSEHGMTLGAIRRMQADEEAIMRRAGMGSSQAGASHVDLHASEPRDVLDRHIQTAHRVQLVNSPSPPTPSSPPVARPQYMRATTTPAGRPTPLRSSALAARQSRYRRGTTRNDPLVVSSDSESGEE